MRVKNQDLAKKIRTSVYIKKGEWWCIRYIASMTNLSEDELLREGWRRGIEKINNPKTKVRQKPRKAGKNCVIKFLFAPAEYRPKTMIAMCNRDLIKWRQSDVIRYGLRQMIKDYSVRFPEMVKIISKYEKEDENETI